MRHNKKHFQGSPNVNENAVPTILISCLPQWKSCPDDEECYEDVNEVVLKAYLEQGWVFKNHNRVRKELQEWCNEQTVYREFWELEYRPNDKSLAEFEIDILANQHNPKITLNDQQIEYIRNILKSVPPTLHKGGEECWLKNHERYRGLRINIHGQLIIVYGERIVSANPLGVWQDTNCLLERYLIDKIYNKIDPAIWKTLLPYIPSKHWLESTLNQEIKA